MVNLLEMIFYHSYVIFGRQIPFKKIMFALRWICCVLDIIARCTGPSAFCIARTNYD
jgi:hypothetical protein